MKSKTPAVLAAVTFAVIAIGSLHCRAHEQVVHMKISEVAAVSSPELTSFLSEQLGTTYAPFNSAPALRLDSINFNPKANPPIEWIRQGSNHEDDAPHFMHHFYTVTRNVKQITDTKGWQNWGLSAGVDGEPLRSIHPIQSFTWASQKGSGNIDNWETARLYEYGALSANSRADREANLAGMLLTLGHLIHLNQDLSQPGHTRNDQHPPWENPWIEKYGKEMYQQRPAWFTPPPEERRGWPYWQSAGFEKLEDFWDKHLYNGQNSTKLNEDASGQVKLGLAEFSNGNFLSEDTTYGAYFRVGTEQYNLHFFPFPARASSTQYGSITAQIQSGDVDPRDYADRQPRRSVYLHKTGDGIQFRNHSVLPFFITMNLNKPNVLQNVYREYTPHIFDPNVLIGITPYCYRKQSNIALGF